MELTDANGARHPGRVIARQAILLFTEAGRFFMINRDREVSASSGCTLEVRQAALYDNGSLYFSLGVERCCTRKENVRIFIRNENPDRG